MKHINTTISLPPRRRTRVHRGLTLLELLLGLSITSMVALAVSGMMSAVNTGMTTQRDNRSVMIRSGAVQSRLGAYIAPSQCILAGDADSLVLWLHDDREGGLIHVSELRWLTYDADAGTISVSWVSFPDNWTNTMISLADREYRSNSDWDAVLAGYTNLGYVSSVVLVDGLSTATISIDQPSTLNSVQAEFALGFTTQGGAMDILVTAALRQRSLPRS